MPRTYRIAYQRDLRPGIGLHWKLVMNGEGHWCRADEHVHRFTTREAAEAAGEAWVRTGGAGDGRMLHRDAPARVGRAA